MSIFLEAVKWLMKRSQWSSSFLYYRQNEDKFTPLEFAIMTSEYEMVKLLLDNGAKENPECKRNYIIYFLVFLLRDWLIIIPVDKLSNHVQYLK